MHACISHARVSSHLDVRTFDVRTFDVRTFGVTVQTTKPPPDDSCVRLNPARRQRAACERCDGATKRPTVGGEIIIIINTTTEASMSDGATTTTTTTIEGEWQFGHIAGACDIAHAKRASGADGVVTCGGDCLVTVRDDGSGEIDASFDDHTDAVNALAVSPCGTQVCTASDDYAVKVFSIAKGGFEANVTRFTLPVRAIAWSADGKYVAAGGEDTAIKVIKMEDKSVQFLLECTRSKCIKSLAFDPRGDFLAATDDNGACFVWVLRPQSDDEEPGDVVLNATLAPVATGESPLLNTAAWRPDGEILAVPGRENDVMFLERGTFKELEWTLKAHTAPISLLRWSPNGKYLLTASQDNTVIIWDVKKKAAVSKMTDTQQLVCGASWKSSGNTVALINGDGQWAIWNDAVPAKYASPTAKVAASEIDFVSKIEAADGFVDDEAIGEDDDDEEDDEEMADFVEYDDDRRARRGSEKPQIIHVEAGPKPQAAFQSLTVAPVAGSNRRFLAYNMIGSLVSTTEGNFSSVEFQFHDTSRLGRIPTIADYNGYTMGVIGEKGCALASPMKDSETESMLYFRCYESWSNDSEWQISMPAGEDILAIATGSSWVAAVTSKRYLRIYSLGGAQKQIISLEGDAVTITGSDDSLAVVWHEAAPIGPAPGDQVLAYAVYNLRYSSQLARGRVPLSAQAKLNYLGFSEEGMLCSADSTGVVRMRTEDFGGSWVPVYRSSAARSTDGQHHWVVSLSASTLYCIITRTSVGPTPNPRPVLSMLPLSLPVVIPEHSLGDLEDEAAKASLALSVAQSSGDDIRLALGASEKAAIRLFHAACKAEKLERASDIAETFRQPKSLQAVLKLPAVARQSALVMRINELIETAIDPEPTQYTQPDSYTPAPVAVKTTPAAKSNPLARRGASTKSGDENKDANEQPASEIKDAKRDIDTAVTPSAKKSKSMAVNPFAR